ncbi:MAG: N-acylneuraminate cytidylyltransferase [Syntrophorhabdus sp. PtaU1.Bin050]|nr:MAG: N-acylneuraminate cytidylyltransferase [Syntrophorhabdus sp. PtaU1.Bin050]
MNHKQNYSVFGIIPARGGSKGVPRKNIRLVGGRPLISYSIQAARESRAITSFLVSTEDREIEAISRFFGADVLLRPDELGRDDTPMLPVIEHALSEAEKRAGPQDYIILLQPTAPLRTAEDIDMALALLIDKEADSVVSVEAVSDYHPSRMYRLLDEGRLTPYALEPTSRLRQELPLIYHRNGAIYACKVCLIKEKHTLIGPDTLPYIMPRSRSLNIDDEFDIHLADLLLKEKNNWT